MQIEDLTEQSYELLKLTLSRVVELESEATDDCKFRRAFILGHTKCILQITEDILELEDRKRTSSSPLLVRGILENLFILGAAAQKEGFVWQKIIYDFEATAKYARRKAKKTSSKGLKEYLEEQASDNDSIAKNIRREHQIGDTDKFQWSPVDCAQEAGLFRQYAIEYAHYSAATHGEFLNIALRGRGTAHVIRTVGVVCLQAVKFILPTIKTEEYLDLAKQHNDLFKELTEMERVEK